MRLLVVVAALVLASCSPNGGGEGPSPRAEATVSPAAPAPDPACPNQEAVVGDESLRAGNTASGDVDGDGDADSVSVHFDPQGEAGCQAFVVAETAGGVVAGALRTWRDEFGLPMPTLNALQDVDGERGDEVVVNMGVGASTQFVGIVVEDDGILRQVTAEGPDRVAEGLFGFGGSVGHVEAVDCAPEGGVVVSFAAPVGDVYRVVRRFLSFEGAELVQERKEVERVLLEELDRFPEYAASPFGSCS